MFQSRKFRAMLFDIAISTAVYFVGRYVDPEVGKDILWVIGTWQPAVLAYILGTAYEDGQEKAAPRVMNFPEPKPAAPPAPEG